MSIDLNNIASGYNLQAINDNFSKIALAINSSLLWRKGSTAGETQMFRDLDMNGFRLLNADLDGSSLTNDRAIRVPASEGSLPALPPAEERKGKLLSFNVNTGLPEVVVPESGSALDVLNQLSSTDVNKGAYLVGFNDPVSGPTTVNAALIQRIKTSDVLSTNGSIFGYKYSADATQRNAHDRIAERLSIMDFVQVEDAGDYSKALQRIFTKYQAADAFHIDFPSGYFPMKTQAIYDGTATVSISGQNGTTLSLEWPSAQANIAITSVRRIYITHLEIVVSPVAGSTRIGFYLNSTGQDHSHNLRQLFASATIATPNTGIIVFDIVNPALSDFSDCYIRYFGAYANSEFSNNIGFRLSATTKISTDSRFENCAIVGLELPYLVTPPNGTSGYLEGVAWINCTIVDCLYGPSVTGDNTNTYKSPMYRWIGGHIFAYKACLNFYWVSQIIVQGGIFYLVYDPAKSGAFGNSAILLNETVTTQIDNCIIRMTNQVTGDTTSQGVFVGTNCNTTSCTNLMIATASKSRGVVSVPGSKYTTAFNVKVNYNGAAPIAAVALGGTGDENLGGNSVRPA